MRKRAKAIVEVTHWAGVWDINCRGATGAALKQLASWDRANNHTVGFQENTTRQSEIG